MNTITSLAAYGENRDLRTLRRALAELDGLFAGIKYFDATSSAPDPLARELDELSEAAPTHPQLPQTAEAISPWLSSIQDVRNGMQHYWETFVNISQRPDTPIINRLRETYKDARGLHETGLFAFRNIVEGYPLTDLKKVFALCSLSYVVSQLLHKKGRFEATNILAGVTIWLQALKDPEEQEAFRQLAEHIWPAAQNNLHSCDLGTAALPSNDFASPSDPTTGLTAFASGFVSEPWSNFNATSSVGDLFLSPPSFGFPATGSTTDDSASYGRTTESESPNHFDPYFLPSQPPFNTSTTAVTQYSHGTNQSQPIDPLLADMANQPSARSAPGASWGVMNNPRDLRNTAVFIAVDTYHQECREFWYGLSSNGAISRDTSSILACTQERAREKKRIHDEYLSRLLSESIDKDCPSRGIVSMVDALVETECLQSIEDATSYMIEIGRPFFPDSFAYGHFVTWIMSKPPTPPSSQHLSPTNSSVDSHAPVGEYACPHCHRRFKRKWNMERHIANIHKASKEDEEGPEEEGGRV